MRSILPHWQVVLSSVVDSGAPGLLYNVVVVT